MTNEVLGTQNLEPIANQAQVPSPVQDRDRQITWPPLPKHCTPSIIEQSPRTQCVQTTARRVVGKEPAQVADEQVIAILKPIVTAMRVLLSSLHMPAARNALQMLDLFNPVLAALQ